MSFALLFSGQGMQHPQMLPWLVEDAHVRDMRARLGVEDWRSALADATWAARNAHAQTLLTGLAVAAWAQLAPFLPLPIAVAGYSVGELAAFSVAGVFDAATAIELAPRRADAMDRCGAGMAGGMLAVSGLAEPALDRLCRDTGVALAIRNGVESVVLGGMHAPLNVAEAAATQQGARCTRLRVNVASHTPWMRQAAESFANSLHGMPFQRPQTLLFSNAADRIHDASEARTALAAQIACPVRWDKCTDSIRARHVQCVLEVGPGRALADMWNRHYPEVPARACDDFRSVSAVVAWVSARADA